MKKTIIFMLIILILISGCKSRTVIIDKDEKTNENIVKIVELYNNAIFSKDWNNVEIFLSGGALRAFQSNYKNYDKSSILLQQYNEYVLGEELFVIVDSKIDYQMIGINKEKVLTSKWVRYYLEYEEVWKITKMEEIPYKYSKKVKISENEFEDVTTQVIRDFISASVEADIKKASKYLSGRLLIESEKFRIDSFPKSSIKVIETLTLACFENEQIIKAKYELENNQKINLNFRVINIGGIWLIDEIIN